MRERTLFIVKYYFSLIALSILYKPVFLLMNGGCEDYSMADYLCVIFHGLPHDFAVAGYFTTIPLLLTATTLFADIPLKGFFKGYNTIIATAIALAFVADATLYPYWEFKLDATVLMYINSPSNAIASISLWHLILLTLIFSSFFSGIYLLLGAITPERFNTTGNCIGKRIFHLAIAILAGGAIFIGIRGGTTESTNNIGSVFFSDKTTLNHAAVNPVFSFIYSSMKVEDFSKEYTFMDDEERELSFSGLYSTDNEVTDTLLNKERPNIITIIFEGLSAGLVKELGGKSGVTPNISALASEGVVFTHCYANSFRTDRGIICTLSGYPSFPKTSVMKAAAKSRKLPSLATSLAKAGYKNTFLYGGDINFTNMRGYLYSTGYERILSDKDFTAQERTTHQWGANDDITFDRLYHLVMEQENEPWHITHLTLSSHEPWEVPYSRIADDKIANSFAFTDEMLGKFVKRLKATDKWDNTLIICISDHTVTGYPAGIRQTDKERNHILFMMSGGAIKKARRIDTICNQTDFVATLLAQLQIPNDEFRFSRNILSPRYTYPFVYHCYNNGVSLMDSTGYSVYDLTGKMETTTPTEGNEKRIKRAKAILQSTYNDFFNL